MVLRLREVRQKTSGKVIPSIGQVQLYLEKEGEDDPYDAGVSIMLSWKVKETPIEWEPMPVRKITARLDSIHKTIAIIWCHSLISDATEEGITSFCEEVQSLVGKVSRRSVPLLMGDINAKMGTDNAGRSAAMCQYAVGQIDENCEPLKDICSSNHLVIGGNLFACKQLLQTTWVSTGRYIRIKSIISPPHSLKVFRLTQEACLS